jgi:hypothetical protein
VAARSLLPDFFRSVLYDLRECIGVPYQYMRSWRDQEIENELSLTACFFRVWDRDQFSKDDIIGIVFFDLNNLLLNKDTSEINGWFPIYDTFRGTLLLLTMLLVTPPDS